MEKLVEQYINEAKEAIDIDGIVVSLLSKKECDVILKKHGITNQLFAQIVKMTNDYYENHLAGKKAGPIIGNEEIKAKFPDIKYVQDITVRSFLCHIIENNKEDFDNSISSEKEIQKSAIKDLSINLAIVQLKKIYKIGSLKFTKLLSKDDASAISEKDIKEIRKELLKQIDDGMLTDTIPTEIKSLTLDKSEKINATDLVLIKKEIEKINLITDDVAIRNVNKYLSAITETFNFLKLHFKKLNKDHDNNKKILDDAYKNNDTVFIDKIKEILSSLGNINSYSMKEDFENMNVIAWCHNVIELKLYHTMQGAFLPITSDLERKVVSILNRYKPAQRNSYDAYHLVEDFIEICRDHTGEIKISHNVTDLMLTQILKDFMNKRNDEVNKLSRVSSSLNKVKVIETNKNDEGEVEIINNKTEKERRIEVEKIIKELSSNTSKSRKFFLDLYNGLTDFNGKKWEGLNKKTQDSIMKAAKINRDSAEFLELKLNRKIEKTTGINPLLRETQISDELKEQTKKENRANMTKEALSFIKKFKSDKENYRDKYKAKIDLMQQVVDAYESTGKISKKVKDIFDKNDEFKYKIIEFALVIPANGNVRSLTLESSEETPLLNKYIGMLNENR